MTEYWLTYLSLVYEALILIEEQHLEELEL